MNTINLVFEGCIVEYSPTGVEITVDKWGRIFSLFDYVTNNLFYVSPTDNYIYRGQSDSTKFLEPSFVRTLKKDLKIKRKKEYNMHLKSHLKTFKEALKGRTHFYQDIKGNDDELWALGQHYGLDTPLLDFTYSFYVAAYFAFLSESNPNGYCAIYAIAKDYINHLQNQNKTVKIFVPETDFNKRIISQYGLFIHFNGLRSLESVMKADKNYDGIKMIKILFPKSEREVALRNLAQMNIHHGSLYPEIDGACHFSNLKLKIKNY